jgi:molybdenum cofactor synthesis domain-containing protein
MKSKDAPGSGTEIVVAKPPLTAAILVIGNEILSGKTRDENIQFIAQELARLGIVLVEARVIRDDKEAIVRAVIECSIAFDYLFTTGGIGPTHDDITAESVAKAFGTTLTLDDEAAKLIGGDRDHPRMRMARIPVGATLIHNTVSRAPGFRIKNTFVLAGVPGIARAMFDSLKNELQRGDEIVSAALDVFLKESEIAIIVGRVAFNNPDVEIGSYPFHREDGVYGTNLVIRGTNLYRIKQIQEQLYQHMDTLGGRPRRT